MTLLTRFKLFDQSSVRWLIAELTVVVLGILIAFQIEGYWTYLEERDEEIISLQGILTDLGEDASRLKASTDRRRNQIVSIEKFVRYLATQNKTAQSFAEHYRPVVWINTYYPVTTTYQGMQNNGRLFVFSSREVSAALTEYQKQQTFFVNLQQSSNRRWHSLKEMTKTDIHFAMPGFAYSGAELVTVRLRDNDDFQHMLVYLPVEDAPRTPGVRAELGDYAALVNGLIGGGERLLSANQELQSLIQAHLRQLR